MLPLEAIYELVHHQQFHLKKEETDVKENRYKIKLVWRNISAFIYFHIAALYGVYLIFASARIATTVFGVILSVCGGFGITAGAHRLWSHKSYKAKLPLQLLLIVFNTIAFQNSVIEWCRDHRVHHKFSETDADPHNAKRGFFFSHLGWLLCRKHPQVKEKGKKIDMTDLTSDPLLAFQDKYYILFMPILCFVIPTIIPMYFWNESFNNAYNLNLLRWVASLNSTWLVNSAAHMWGNKPYDKNIKSAENTFVATLALGEGWHNYHHTFPWDYKTSELGTYSMNFSLAFINFFAKIGWAYDLKTVSEEMIRKRVERTGDGSHHIWGWGDQDQPETDYNGAVILNKKS